MTPPMSSPDLTRLLRKLDPFELKMIADEYALQVNETPGLLARLTGGGVNEQAYELAGHASRRTSLNAVQKLLAIVQKNRPDLFGIHATQPAPPPTPLASSPSSPSLNENPFADLQAKAQAKTKALKNPNRPLSVFLSYAHEDNATVARMYAELKQRGFDVWFDQESLLPGVDWQYEIRTAVKKADVLLAFLSEKAITKRGYINKEATLALDTYETMPQGHIYLIPVRIEPCDLPERFSHVQTVDLFAPNGFARLLNALEKAKEQRNSREAS